MTRHIELHIEKLVLHGFDPQHRDRIAQAAERELARLLGENGVPTSLAVAAQVARMDGGRFDLVAGSTPDVTGSQLAWGCVKGSCDDDNTPGK